MGDFEEDLAWSRSRMDIASDTIKSLFKQIPNLFNEDELVIHPVEGIDEEILKQLDRKCGIDYFITNKDGSKAISFAWRAGNSTRERCRDEGVYNAFSLREKRNSATSKIENCEIAKRLYAIKYGLVYPLFTVETCFIDDILLSAAIARTEDVFDAYVNCPVRVCNKNAKYKKVFFYGVSWEIMKQNGYAIYDWYLNDKCKRTYRPYDYHMLSEIEQGA